MGMGCGQFQRACGNCIGIFDREIKGNDDLNMGCIGHGQTVQLLIHFTVD